jgi:hypothetical protein
VGGTVVVVTIGGLVVLDVDGGLVVTGCNMLQEAVKTANKTSMQRTKGRHVLEFIKSP